jgi:hypothetical protein
VSTWRIPVEFKSRRYRGSCCSEIREIDVSGDSAFEAAQKARNLAASRIGQKMANGKLQVFTISSVELRMDLFKEPR